jgi:hypothetical protein
MVLYTPHNVGQWKQAIAVVGNVYLCNTKVKPKVYPNKLHESSAVS